METRSTATRPLLGEVVDRIIARMDLPLEPWQEVELRSILVNKLYYEWPATTLEAIRKAVS